MARCDQIGTVTIGINFSGCFEASRSFPVSGHVLGAVGAITLVATLAITRMVALCAAVRPLVWVVIAVAAAGLKGRVTWWGVKLGSVFVRSVQRGDEISGGTLVRAWGDAHKRIF